MLQPFLQERKHYSNRTSLCVFSTRIKTVNEQTPKLTGVNIYLLKAQGQLYVRAEGPWSGSHTIGRGRTRGGN